MVIITEGACEYSPEGRHDVTPDKLKGKFLHSAEGFMGRVDDVIITDGCFVLLLTVLGGEFNLNTTAHLIDEEEGDEEVEAYDGIADAPEGALFVGKFNDI